MPYILLMYENEAEAKSRNAEEGQRIFGEYMAFTADIGHRRAGEPLEGPSHATIVIIASVAHVDGRARPRRGRRHGRRSRGGPGDAQGPRGRGRAAELLAVLRHPRRFAEATGRHAEALPDFERGLELAKSKPERRYMARRVAEAERRWRELPRKRWPSADFLKLFDSIRRA